MHKLLAIIGQAQDLLAAKLRISSEQGSFDREAYGRYLSMQYHLTKGVQRYFITASAHESLSDRRVFRKFLFYFANEEELHFTLAEKDLAHLGLSLTQMPFDVELWHYYFTQVTVERPFVRLGAACILENLSAGSVKEPLAELLSASFLSKDNMRFIILHKHEVLPHGEQILEAIRDAKPNESEMSDLEYGARRGALFYLRMTDWVLRTGTDQDVLFPDPYRDQLTSAL